MIKLKRNKKMAIIITIIILLVVIIARNPYRNVSAEVIIFPEGERFIGSSVYRFIVQNDGTFISYTGIAIHTNLSRPNTIMLPLFRRRARISLNDDDFHNIEELVDLSIKNYSTAQSRVFGLWEISFLHDGNVYERRIIEIDDLANELVRLSPLMTRWHDHRISPNP